MKTIKKTLSVLCLVTAFYPLTSKSQTNKTENDSLTNLIIQKADSVATIELKKNNDSSEAKNCDGSFSLKDYNKNISITSDLGTDTYHISYYYKGSNKLPPGCGHFSVLINSRTKTIEYFPGK